MSVPKKFTDEYLQDKKRMLVAQIGQLEAKNESLERFDLEHARDWLNTCYKIDEQVIAQQRADPFGGAKLGSMPRLEAKTRSLVAKLFDGINPMSGVKDAQEKVDAIYKEISKNKRDIDSCQAKLRELEALLRKTPDQRAEEHYQSLIRTKDRNPSKEDLPELIGQFGEFIDYKPDARAMKQECVDLAMKWHYNDMVQLKNQFDLCLQNATTDEEYRRLCDCYRKVANEFGDASGYADTEELAKQCDELSNECDNQYRVTKSLREEQERTERKEKEHRETLAEQQRKDAKSTITVVGGVLGLLIGGIVAAFLSTFASGSQYATNDELLFSFLALAVVVPLLIFASLWADDAIGDAYVTGCGWGCGTVIVFFLLGGGMILLGLVTVIVPFAGAWIGAKIGKNIAGKRYGWR